MENSATEVFNIAIHHQILTDNKCTSKQAHSQRKSIAHLVKCSCKILNNTNTTELIDNKIESYSDIWHRVQENIYDDKLKSLLSKSKNVTGNNFKTKLTNISAKQYVNPLPCTNVKSQCPESEIFSEGEFAEFMEVFKNKKSSNIIKNEVSFNQKVNKYPSSFKTDSKVKKSDQISNTGVFNSFKTAREELEVQSLQKYGTGHQSNGNQSSSVKRKLGKAGVRGKFIPPIKSNSGSNDDIKMEGVDERLKNIEPKMIELIKSEIMDCTSSLHWNDIAGLSFAKTAIQEAVVWPMLRPDIFTGLRKPPKGILLFGPPGTGKTLIGKCVASQSKSTFFSISASSLTSKWVGDGEKMVRALFAVARVHQPSVIFIDEVDSLLSQRTDTEHESSRRIKTEFLVQLDGATTDSEERLLVIGATNRPQELDEAARRRFVRRLYIPLPEYEARLQLVQKLISGESHQLREEDFQKVASLSDGYSGADIKNLCSEASLGPIRSIDMHLIEHIQASDVRPLLMGDFEKALLRVKSSVAAKDLEQYISWDQIYGSGF